MYSWCVAGGNGRSFVANFDVPCRVLRRMRVTIDPVVRLPRRQP